MVLGMNIFTSFFVLLLLLSKNVPSATDKIPLIGAYYCLNMVMIATSTCACTVVVHIFFRGQGGVPYIIRKIFLEFLARIFCMITPPVLPPIPVKRSSSKRKLVPPPIIMTQPPSNSVLLTSSITNLNQSNNNNIQHQILNRLSTTVPISSRTASSTALNYDHDLSQTTHLHPSSQNKLNYSTLPLSGTNRIFTTYQQSPHQHTHTPQQNAQLANELNLSFNLIENDVKEIRDYLRHTRKKLDTTDSKSKQTNEWKQVALVLDRALFFLYVIAIFVSVTVMFKNI
jgi:hypothetical protein